MSERDVIELHIQGAPIPTRLFADLGKAMSKHDPDATLTHCDDHDGCRFLITAKATP